MGNMKNKKARVRKVLQGLAEELVINHFAEHHPNTLEDDHFVNNEMIKMLVRFEMKRLKSIHG